MGWLFISFAIWKIFHLMQSHFSSFVFLVCTFDVIVKKPLPRQMSRSFSPVFSFRSFTVVGIILKFFISWVDFCIWYKIKVQFHPFACRYPVFNTICWRDYPLFHCIFFILLLKISLTMCGFISRLSFLFHWSICLYASNIILITVAVVQSLSCFQLFVTPQTTTCQASLPFTISWSLLRFVSIQSVILSNHLILCHPFLLLP